MHVIPTEPRHNAVRHRVPNSKVSPQAWGRFARGLILNVGDTKAMYDEFWAGVNLKLENATLFLKDQGLKVPFEISVAVARFDLT